MNSSTLLRKTAFLLGAGTALWLGGCATATQPAQMATGPVAVQNQSQGSVLVQVAGGNETNPLWKSQISNADFAAAIRKSISESKLFARIADAMPGDYRLDVMIARIQQPSFGASFSVSMECSWRLTHVPENAVVWEKAVTSSFTASMGDAFVGVTRLRLATEGAARANIADALAQIGRLQLK